MPDAPESIAVSAMKLRLHPWADFRFFERLRALEASGLARASDIVVSLYDGSQSPIFMIQWQDIPSNRDDLALVVGSVPCPKWKWKDLRLGEAPLVLEPGFYFVAPDFVDVVVLRLAGDGSYGEVSPRRYASDLSPLSPRYTRPAAGSVQPGPGAWSCQRCAYVTWFRHEAEQHICETAPPHRMTRLSEAKKA